MSRWEDAMRRAGFIASDPDGDRLRREEAGVVELPDGTRTAGIPADAAAEALRRAVRRDLAARAARIQADARAAGVRPLPPAAPLRVVSERGDLPPELPRGR